MGTSDPHLPAAVRRRGGRSRNSVVLQLAAFALTFILVAGLVVTSSRAAFVAQNDNSSNQITAASIDLTDTDSGTAMFNQPGLLPGASVQKCIEVTYTGNIDPLPVQIYATGAPTGTGLATYLNVTIDIAAANGDAFGSCTNFGVVGGSTNVYTGTLATFASTYPSYASSRSTTWDPTGTGQARAFRFTISVQDNSLAEGLNSTFGFSWETRTN